MRESPFLSEAVLQVLDTEESTYEYINVFLVGVLILKGLD
jgi:hypothetical protein